MSSVNYVGHNMMIFSMSDRPVNISRHPGSLVNLPTEFGDSTQWDEMVSPSDPNICLAQYTVGMKKHHKITALERDQIAWWLACGIAAPEPARGLGKSPYKALSYQKP
jgi:hypothetical protein